jgi:hypothetical protein
MMMLLESGEYWEDLSNAMSGVLMLREPAPRKDPSSRFQLNVTAGSQKRAILNLRKSEGKNESRFA